PLLLTSSPPPHDLHSFPTRRYSDLAVPTSESVPRRGGGFCRSHPATPPTVCHAGGRSPQCDDYGSGPRGAAADCTGRAWGVVRGDRKSTRLNSSHVAISYAVFCLKK